MQDADETNKPTQHQSVLCVFDVEHGIVVYARRTLIDGLPIGVDNVIGSLVPTAVRLYGSIGAQVIYRVSLVVMREYCNAAMIVDVVCALLFTVWVVFQAMVVIPDAQNAMCLYVLTVEWLQTTVALGMEKHSVGVCIAMSTNG